MLRKPALSIVALLLFVSATAYAETEDSKNPFTKESICKHFRYTISPQQAFLKAREIAKWLAEEGESGVQVFGAPSSQWNNMDGYHLFFQVWRCSDGAALAHPNPSLQHLTGTPGVLNMYKDHAGKLAPLSLCSVLKQNPAGGWSYSYTTYIKSVTKVEEPFFTLMLGVSVPGRPWSVVTYLPYEEDSEKKVKVFVEDLNALVDEWSRVDE